MNRTARIHTMQPRIQEATSGMRIQTWSDGKRIRGTTLQNIRKVHFARFPLCVGCLAKTPERTSMATELDHRIPLHQGGTDTPDNRQGLCFECHLEKSKTERGHAYLPRSSR